eukprot:10518084-Heterocapsa_arctica.AAC.1
MQCGAGAQNSPQHGRTSIVRCQRYEFMAQYNCHEQHPPPLAHAENIADKPWIILISSDFPKRQDNLFWLPKAP